MKYHYFNMIICEQMKNKGYLLSSLMKTFTYFFLPMCKKQFLHLPFFYPLPQTYKNNNFFPTSFM